MYKRLLKIDLPQKQSAFLWGARKTGKSTFLKQQFPRAVYYDLLKTDLFVSFSENPVLFRQEILALSKNSENKLVVVDEIQRIPELLNEVHYLIENTDCNFILCGSSARKLKRLGVNLLGGRAWGFRFFPLVFPEVDDFDLFKALTCGLIPSHYLAKDFRKSLLAYVQDYLTEEIRQEGLVRNLPSFARFLEAVAFCHGEMINYANIARDCGVSAVTVKEYFQILVDTLIGYYLWPYSKQGKREIIRETPKFYLFDVGVSNILTKSFPEELKGSLAGKAFEHFIFMELLAYKNLSEKLCDIFYWRTKTGLEVDFVFGDVPIEIKISSSVKTSEIKGLVAFCQEYSPKAAYVVSLDPRPRMIAENIMILPYKDFLERLWSGNIL